MDSWIALYADRNIETIHGKEPFCPPNISGIVYSLTPKCEVMCNGHHCLLPYTQALLCSQQLGIE